MDYPSAKGPSAMVDNPYWDAVKDHVHPGLWGVREVGGFGSYGSDYERWARETPQRETYVKRYAWTITTPEAVQFVADQCGGRLVDPMAGTGYWGWMLAQHGVDVVSYDRDPGGNHWHKGHELHATVDRLEGVEAAALHVDRTLLLAWPPYDTDDGVDILNAYHGARVIYIGEGEGGCTGNDDLHHTLAKDWREVASHAPVQWMGIHDYITVYDRA